LLREQVGSARSAEEATAELPRHLHLRSSSKQKSQASGSPVARQGLFFGDAPELPADGKDVAALG
jgi:hypothetical protein